MLPALYTADPGGRFRNPRGSERTPPAPCRFKVEAEPGIPAPPPLHPPPDLKENPQGILGLLKHKLF